MSVSAAQVQYNEITNQLFYNEQEIKIGNGAGIVNWPKYADSGLDYFITKSIGLNKPEGELTPEIEALYWNGYLTRPGWNPPVMVKGEDYFVNRMGLPNPGVQHMIEEIRTYAGKTPIMVSIFGNDEELVRMIELFEGDAEVASKISGYEINKSCPNTCVGDICFTNIEEDFEEKMHKLKREIKNIRNKTTKELYVKINPLEDAANYMQAFKEIGVDGITISNTIPTKVINEYSGLKIITGGLSGRKLLEHTLANVWRAKQTGIDLPINFSGGIDSIEDAYLAILAGATTIQLGSIYAGKTPEEIKVINKILKRGLCELLNKPTPELEFNEPEWMDDVKFDEEEGRRVLTVINNEHKEYTIKEIIKESYDTYTIKFDKKIEHKPGQYLMAMIWGENGPMERPFTFSGKYTITVRAIGEMTNALTNLEPGDKVYIRGPYGNGYPIDELKDKNVLLIGGGCGVASFPDLIRKTDAEFDSILSYTHEKGIIRRLGRIINYNSKNCDVMINDKIPVNEINFKEYDYVITCGPEPMMEAVAKEAIKQGIPENRILLSLEEIIKCAYGLCYGCDRGVPFCLTGPIVPRSKSKKFYERDKSGAKIESIVNEKKEQFLKGLKK